MPCHKRELDTEFLHSRHDSPGWARELKQKNEVRLVIVAIASLAILLIVGLSVALQRPLYVSQTSLTTTYNTPFANAYWKAAYFNDSQGTERAFFNFVFRDTNDSLGPVLSTIQFGPGLSGSYLDSAKFTFTSETPLTWPDVAFRMPLNGLAPTEISRVDTQTVLIHCQSLGLGGQSTEVFYLFFFSSRRRHTRLTCDWSSDVCSSDLWRWCCGGAHMQQPLKHLDLT